MKELNWIKITGINFLIIVMILSPFIPGPSNKLVQVLSSTGQLTGLFGLVLIPIGIMWTIFEMKKLKVTNGKEINFSAHYRMSITVSILTACIFLIGAIFVPNPQPKMFLFFGFLIVLSGTIIAKQYVLKWERNSDPIYDRGSSIILAGTALPCISFIGIFTLIFTFLEMGIIAGVITVLLISTGMYWGLMQIRNLKVGARKLHQAPVYLLTIPIVAFFTYMFIREKASNFSRDFAIKRSETLISAIENHKNRTGHYPATLRELDSISQKKILKPFVMGIEDFRYNRINDQYSISFSQWPDLGLEEIVLYDKSDLKNNLTGEFAKYNYDFDLCRVKGAFASYDTRFLNWRYYHVD